MRILDKVRVFHDKEESTKLDRPRARTEHRLCGFKNMPQYCLN